ncbi:DnaK suppressor protein [Variovorax boronicumulans]|uniref:TraR/DksA family transcriptional regulator n=1 Tax=Variovorax boronicumulans TaxID=436515 RepID=UPI00277FEB38|nr:TraR/DksA C4-type zinc finger protein [Variovorax boronicumulans]MDQ0036885.1 DnaK suppressor protein [Variovorax boronicumulans]
MRHLDTADRRVLQMQLGMMRRQLLDELRTSAPSAQAALAESDREVKTRADQAEAERAGDVHMAEVEIDRARLEEIEHAIARLASGRYGICEDCGDEIPRARLLAQPTAIRCMACQASDEARRRH